ncbi:hypothetical protein WB896_004438 [Vibrio vulnificus]|nr:hypothetical protein [Vibrio parahaemolyticus]
MLSYYERNLDYLELTLGTIPMSEAVTFDLGAHIVPQLTKGVHDNEAIYSFNDGDASIHLAEVTLSEDKRFATLLFHYADKSISDPAFKSLDTGEVRTEKKSKEKNEGIAVSAHLVIDLENALGQKDSCYFALLELVPHLSKSLLSRALNYFFNKALTGAKFTNPKTQKKIRPSFSFDSLTCTDLVDGLKERRLTALTFVSKTLEDDMDENELTPTEQRVSFAVGENVRGEVAYNLLHRASKKARKQGYTTLKVSYEDVYNGNRTGTFNKLDEESLDRAVGVFAKRGKLYCETQLNQCQKSIHVELSSKMVALLIKERGQKDVASDTTEAVQAPNLLANQA